MRRFTDDAEKKMIFLSYVTDKILFISALFRFCIAIISIELFSQVGKFVHEIG